MISTPGLVLLLGVGRFLIEVAPPPREVEEAPREDPARRIERIIRQAQEVGDRLSRKDAGPQTQAQQEGILREIDALLEGREPSSSDSPMSGDNSSGSEKPPPASETSPPSGQPSSPMPMAANGGHSDSVNPGTPPPKTGEKPQGASDSSPPSGKSPARPEDSPAPADNSSSSTNPSSQPGGEKPTSGASRSTTGGSSSNGSKTPGESASSRPGGLPSVSDLGPMGGIRSDGRKSEGPPRRVYRNRMNGEVASGVESEVRRPVSPPGKPMEPMNHPPMGKDWPVTPAGTAGATPATGGPTPAAKPLWPWGGNFEKDVWGHLPEQLRQQVSQYYRQQFMPKYADLLRHYYSSLSRGESPSAPARRP